MFTIKTQYLTFLQNPYKNENHGGGVFLYDFKNQEHQGKKVLSKNCMWHVIFTCWFINPIFVFFTPNW